MWGRLALAVGGMLALGTVSILACEKQGTTSPGDGTEFSHVDQALAAIEVAFDDAQEVSCVDARGDFEITKYTILADGIRFTNPNGRYAYIPWDYWTRGKYALGGRVASLSWDDAGIELTYFGDMNAARGKGGDADRFFAAIRYVARSHTELAQKIVEQPVQISALVRLQEAGDCTRTGPVAQKLAELESAGVRETWAAAQLGDIPALVTEARAYAVWLVHADVYLRTCQRPAEIPEAALASATSVPEHFVEGALEAKHCGLLHGVNRLGLWPFPERFASEVVLGDFNGADVTRGTWIKTSEQYRVACAQTLGSEQIEALQAQEDRLRRVVGLDDDVLAQIRVDLISALEAGDADTVLKLAHEVHGREQQIDASNAAAHDARLAAVEQMVDEELRAGASEEASVARTTRQVLRLFGI